MKHSFFLCVLVLSSNLFGALVDPTAGVNPDVVAPIETVQALPAASDANDSTSARDAISADSHGPIAGSMVQGWNGPVAYLPPMQEEQDWDNHGRRWGRGDDEAVCGSDCRGGRWRENRPPQGRGFRWGRGGPRGSWGSRRGELACDCQCKCCLKGYCKNAKNEDMRSYRKQPRGFRGRMERQDVMRLEDDSEMTDDMPVMLSVSRNMKEEVPAAAMPQPIPAATMPQSVPTVSAPAVPSPAVEAHTSTTIAPVL